MNVPDSSDHNKANESASNDQGVEKHGTRIMNESAEMPDDSMAFSLATPQDKGTEWIGRRLGKYKITALLGVGGMGVVLKATDTSMEREVAIKILPAEVSQDEVALQRFRSEAKSAGKINHPNTVTVYEFANEGPVNYLVMEIASGGNVEDCLIQSGAYSVSEATQIAIQVCRGLSTAHEMGLVHRDIKPANLLLTDSGVIKVSDFGLAKRTKAATLQMTQAGQIVGTPYYMSPEQCEARTVDARSDVYALGATYYSLLTGKNPYSESGSAVQVMYAHCTAARPDPREVKSNLPAACAAVIERAMDLDPDSRYQTTEEMRIDLEAILAAISGADIQLPSRPLTTNSQANGKLGSFANRQRVSWFVLAILSLVAIIMASFNMFGWREGKNDAGAANAGLNEGSDGETSQVSPAIVPASGVPIKVGILHSLSGTMANSESPVVDATLLAIEELNLNGGLMGRPVEAVVADGRSEGALFASESQRLIQEEQVTTIFGCWTSASRKMVVPIFEELDSLLIYPLQYEGIEESPNVIYTGAAPNQQIVPAIKWAYAFENKRRFFIVGSDYVFPRVAHEIITDELEELGAELVGSEFLLLGSMDVDHIIEKIVESNPDVILNLINGDSNTAFFSALRKAGITPQDVPTISFSVGEEELRHLDISDMTGDYAAWNYFQSIDSPENKDFVARFRKKYGPQRVITDPMEAAYFGVKLWGQAVEEAGSTDTREICRAMKNQRMRSPGGDIRIDPATQHTFKTPRIGKVQADGQFKIIWTAANPERPVPFPSSRSSEEWRTLLSDLFNKWNGRWSAEAE